MLFSFRNIHSILKNNSFSKEILILIKQYAVVHKQVKVILIYGGIMQKHKPAPKGFRWVCTPHRRVRGSSNKILYAKDYGYEAWCFLVRA